MKSSYSLSVIAMLTFLSISHVKSIPIENSIRSGSLIDGESSTSDSANILSLSQGKGKNGLTNGFLNMDNKAESEAEYIQEKGSKGTPHNEKDKKMDPLGSIQQLLNKPKGVPDKAILKRAFDTALLSTQDVDKLLVLTKLKSNPDQPSNHIPSTKENKDLISQLLSTPPSGESKGTSPLSSLLDMVSNKPDDKRHSNSDKAPNGVDLAKRGLPLDLLHGTTGGKSTTGKSDLSVPMTNSEEEYMKDQGQITRILDDKKEKETAIIHGALKPSTPKEDFLRILEKISSDPATSRILTSNAKEEKQTDLDLE